MTRKAISDVTLTELFNKSARRCALCFCINRDFKEKRGQVAHLDQDHENDKINNLVWLCFDHHDKYDSKTRQSKNYTKHELKNYRDILYSEVEKFKANDPTSHSNQEHAIITNTLSFFFEYIPFARLLSYIDEFPHNFSLDLLDIFDVWETFKRSNPHIYPFKDLLLNQRLEDFFNIQYQLESLCRTSSNDNIEAFSPDVDYRGTNHKLRLNKELPRDSWNEAEAIAFEIKQNYESSYRTLIDYIRDTYPDAKLNSWRK